MWPWRFERQLDQGRGLGRRQGMRARKLGFVLAPGARRLERGIVGQNRGALAQRHPCRAMACELLDVGDQHHAVFQQHGDSSRLRPMTKPTDPSASAPTEQASFGYRDVRRPTRRVWSARSSTAWRRATT